MTPSDVTGPHGGEPTSWLLYNSYLVWANPLKTKDRQFDNFAFTDGTVSCHFDNLWCRQWQQSCQIDNLCFQYRLRMFRLSLHTCLSRWIDCLKLNSGLPVCMHRQLVTCYCFNISENITTLLKEFTIYSKEMKSAKLLRKCVLAQQIDACACRRFFCVHDFLNQFEFTMC